jgi:hypothetical protein
MRTVRDGSGKYGYSYEVMESGEWVKYEHRFSGELQRNAAMLLEKRRRSIRFLKRI